VEVTVNEERASACDTDRQANENALLMEADYTSDPETVALPCIQIKGTQVYVYMENGILNISVYPADEHLVITTYVDRV
jgi:hypothetical protein